MIYNINGLHFYNLIDYGIRNLAIYKDKVNALNVFPVPDGDTGTNMMLTLQNGFAAMKDPSLPLYESARVFAREVAFGARGNSGVIVSQFFKGISEAFFETESVDFCEFVSALENGVKCAYSAVANPVEGTILTVIREAVEYVRIRLDDYQIDSVNDVIHAFLEKAQISLKNTPKLLTVLRSANVVDSGGAGIVYVFEGMKLYLLGKSLPIVEYQQNKSESTIDFSSFNRNSVFEFGYCTEILIQLTKRADDFCLDVLREELSLLGESVVLSLEGDKVKLHIHTHNPEKILAHCHTYGEFLAVKIENMSVQHQEKYTDNVFVSDNGNANISVVAVAHNSSMEAHFFDMGADVVLTGSHSYLPTASDFVRAFGKASSKNILVFPNNKNTCLTAMQAKSLYTDANVCVVNTNSDTECFAVLPMVDYASESIYETAKQLNEAITVIDTVTITRATKDAVFAECTIKSGDYVAMVGDKNLLACGGSLAYVVGASLKKSFLKKKYDVVTVFTDKYVPENIKSAITAFVANNNPLTEVQIIETNDDFYNIILSFE